MDMLLENIGTMFSEYMAEAEEFSVWAEEQFIENPGAVIGAYIVAGISVGVGAFLGWSIKNARKTTREGRPLSRFNLPAMAFNACLKFNTHPRTRSGDREMAMKEHDVKVLSSSPLKTAKSEKQD